MHFLPKWNLFCSWCDKLHTVCNWQSIEFNWGFALYILPSRYILRIIGSKLLLPVQCRFFFEYERH